jgi:hypothetical protein
MPRPKHDGSSHQIEALKKRVEAVHTGTTLQNVPLDAQTFFKVVQFIEQEGCTLQEGLRRAVRMGVEALLLERAEVPTPITQDYGPAFVPPSFPQTMPGYYIGQSSYSQEELDIDAENAGGSEGDYSRKAPPGLA